MRARHLPGAGVTLGVALVAASVGTAAWIGPPAGSTDAGPEGAGPETAPHVTERVVAITVDDLVGQSTLRDTGTYAQIMDGVGTALVRHQAPAIGFVNAVKLESAPGGRDPERVAILRTWLDRGLSLGNHTFSHPDLHQTPVPAWLADLDRGHEILRELGVPGPWYLRHPYLRTGRSLAVKDSVRAHLEAHDYRIAPVSMDNQEWIYARAYDVALDRGDDEQANAVRDDYLDYMNRVVAWYEEQSERIEGKPIAHVLLLHANRLNAVALDPLLTDLADRGYRFVTLDEALADPAWAQPDEYLGPAGITWLHRWAIARGMPGSTFSGEPEASAWVLELSGLD